MKQIFDWLREQMQNRIAYNESCHEEFKDSKMTLVYEVQQNAWKNALAMIDEAEAEWEKDCCEWKDTKMGIFHIKTNCGNWIETNYGYKYCPYCGKRIKISEVE